jgi:ferredoxin
MAVFADRHPQNAPGRYYVDDQCLDCDLCREVVPGVFTRNDDGGFSFVQRQPSTPDEVALCEEVVEGCPEGALGHDGESTPVA